MSGEGAGLCAARPTRERNNHRHGRWVGLFKLSEECGELVVAGLEVLFGSEDDEQPARVRALENELADVGACCRVAVEANPLDARRIYDRLGRRLAALGRTVHPLGRWHGLAELIRQCGLMGQLLGKVSIFPHGNEHPDGHGNLTGRIEAAIADLCAAAQHVADANGLDRDHIEMRADDKVDKFRTWFPADAAESGDAEAVS